MKAERRHELQHNELADWVAQTIDRLKPYSRAITGIALLAAVCLLAYVVISKRAANKKAAAWDEYYQAIQSPSKEGIAADLQAVARDHEGQAGGLWAEVTLADIQLGEGVAALFNDKTIAEKKLKQAVGHYEAILAAADDPLLLSRARFGLARALESRGQLKEARAVYEQIVDAPASAYVSLAKTRLADLNRDSTQDFYAWFAEQEPVAIGDSLPGTPGETLPFDNSVFGPSGDLNFSGEKMLDIPPIGKETPGPLFGTGDKGGDDLPKQEKTEGTKADAEKAGKTTDDADKSDAKEKNTADTPPDDATKGTTQQSDSKSEPPSNEKNGD